MRYVVLDTDVASRVIKHQLAGPLAAKLTGAGWCVTFVTVGELWQWATMRSWGRRSREELEDWLGGVVKLDSDPVISREWGRRSADARRRGRARPANDTWIAELVHCARQHAKAAGCEYLHVDFDDHLAAFYCGACGFRPVSAALLPLG